MILIMSYAEWQNHCSFCAVVVVSVAREDQVEKCRESEEEKVEGKQTITQRTSQKTKDV